MRMARGMALAHRYGINCGHANQYPVVFLVLDLNQFVPEDRRNGPINALAFYVEHEAFSLLLTKLEQFFEHENHLQTHRSNPAARGGPGHSPDRFPS
jgi:hypothetical protein